MRIVSPLAYDHGQVQVEKRGDRHYMQMPQWNCMEEVEITKELFEAFARVFSQEVKIVSRPYFEDEEMGQTAITSVVKAMRGRS